MRNESICACILLLGSKIINFCMCFTIKWFKIEIPMWFDVYHREICIPSEIWKQCFDIFAFKTNNNLICNHISVSKRPIITSNKINWNLNRWHETDVYFHQKLNIYICMPKSFYIRLRFWFSRNFQYYRVWCTNKWKISQKYFRSANICRNTCNLITRDARNIFSLSNKNTNNVS